MEYKNIIYEKTGAVGKIILNRPEAGNTLNLNLAKELYDATNNAFADKALKALILTANGKLFCGGGDLKYLLSKKEDVKKVLLEMTHYFHGAISRMARMDAPVITAINGTAGGGGFSLAIAGDIIYSVKDAKFTLAYTNAGLSPDGSSTYFLPRILGLKKAKELMLTNRLFNADEALDMGLIDKVVNDSEDLKNETDAIVNKIARGPRKAYSSVKKLLNISFSNGLETQMDVEGLHIAENAQSEDGIEGLNAFSEKRSPNFK